MKFYISTVGICYTDPEMILEEYPGLNLYGFGVEHETRDGKEISKAYIKLDNMESLTDFIKDIGFPVIVSPCFEGENPLEIEIYDGYRE